MIFLTTQLYIPMTSKTLVLIIQKIEFQNVRTSNRILGGLISEN